MDNFTSSAWIPFPSALPLQFSKNWWCACQWIEFAPLHTLHVPVDTGGHRNIPMDLNILTLLNTHFLHYYQFYFLRSLHLSFAFYPDTHTMKSKGFDFKEYSEESPTTNRSNGGNALVATQNVNPWHLSYHQSIYRILTAQNHFQGVLRPPSGSTDDYERTERLGVKIGYNWYNAMFG